jgi:hypothetical protein
MRRIPVGATAAIAVAGGYAALYRLGQTWGATRQERRRALAGDELLPDARAFTTHAITIAAPARHVWPWLVQMGWGRAGWYTPRWVDLLLFPANSPSAQRIVPDLQNLEVGDFVPDGPPETKCGFRVEVLAPERALVLHSTSHVPLSWRNRVELDWSWAFVLTPLDDGQRTRYHFRSRWTTSPWWLTASGWLGIVPADFYMSRGMLRGVRERAEATARERRTGDVPQHAGQPSRQPRHAGAGERCRSAARGR